MFDQIINNYRPRTKYDRRLCCFHKCLSVNWGVPPILVTDPVLSPVPGASGGGRGVPLVLSLGGGAGSTPPHPQTGERVLLCRGR